MTKSGQQILLCLGAGAVAVLLFVQHRSQIQVRQENLSLHQQLDKMSVLAAENERLSNRVVRVTQSQSLSNDQLAELMRLRGEVATLRKQKKDLQNQRATLANRPAAPQNAAVRAVKVPRAAWAASGYATPEAALQTVLWAMSRGNLGTYRASLTPRGKEALASQFEGKSDSEAAASLAEEIRDLTELPIDEKRVSADGIVSFVISSGISTGETDDGTTVQMKDDVLLSFRNVGGQWKYSPE